MADPSFAEDETRAQPIEDFVYRVGVAAGSAGESQAEAGSAHLGWNIRRRRDTEALLKVPMFWRGSGS
jgi:hypothetical protein